MKTAFVFGVPLGKPKVTITAKPLKPVSRETGEVVTMRNCHSRECRWSDELPSGDMILCGRTTDGRGAWCAEHRTRVYDRNKPLVRL